MGTIRAVLILSAVLAHSAIAQASSTAQPADPSTRASAGGASSDRAKAPSASLRAAWFADVDLRHCLDRKSNEAIIRCAEGRE